MEILILKLTILIDRCCRRYYSRATQTDLIEKNINGKVSNRVENGKIKTVRAALPFLPKPLVHQASTVSEDKATMVLGVVFSSFVICWAPFFIVNLVVALCGQVCSVPAFIGDMSLWLGYTSSTINPLIYTAFNIKFRRSFGNILLCRKNSFQCQKTGNKSF